MRACETLIAWNGADYAGFHEAPAGSVGIGPLLGEHDRDWSQFYFCTAGAAYVGRRKLSVMEQRRHVMLDWYLLVYGHGIHPYVAHRAFLIIDEYQSIIKDIGLGPAKDELGHDPDVGYGRCGQFPVPQLKVFSTGRGTHFWPEPCSGGTAATFKI